MKSGPDSFDCTGLVWFVYKEIFGIDLYTCGFGQSTTTKMLTSYYGRITLFDETSLQKNLKCIQKGDILFLHTQSLEEKIPTPHNKYPGHCGIYLGENKFIHCSKVAGQVVISDFQ